MFSNTYQHPRIHIKISTITTFLIFMLLIISSLNNVNSAISVVGLLALVLILGITNFFLIVHFSKSKHITKTHFAISSISIAFSTILVIGLMINPSLRGVITTAQFVAIIGFTLFLSQVQWSDFKIKIVGFLTSLFVLFHFALWTLSGFQPLFASIYNNSNLVGPYMLYSLFFILWARMNSKRKIFYNLMIILCLLTMYGSGTRSAMLAGFIGFMTYFVWKTISKSGFLFKGYLLTVYGITLSVLFFYPYLPYWKHFIYFEELMITYTGKSLMSGRDDIWRPIINLVNENPLIGYGTGVQTTDLSTLTHSTHNYFLQVAMQNGYLGLFLILTLLFSIWLSFWKARDNKTVKLVAAFFIATIVYQYFEISLTQNQMSVGLMQWLIISIGLSQVIHRPAPKEIKHTSY